MILLEVIIEAPGVARNALEQLKMNSDELRSFKILAEYWPHSKETREKFVTTLGEDGTCVGNVKYLVVERGAGAK